MFTDFPLSNINNKFVNVYNSHNPSNFTSTTIPGLPGLAGAKNNIDAASGKVPGICLFKGGSKSLKRKIKNINKKYKMSRKSKKIRSIKNKLRKKYGTKKYRTKKHLRKMYGGYSQYQNNLPLTPTYSVTGAGNLNIPTYKLLSNCTNCVDNYNHFINKGFTSRGH